MSSRRGSWSLAASAVVVLLTGCSRGAPADVAFGDGPAPAAGAVDTAAPSTAAEAPVPPIPTCESLRPPVTVDGPLSADPRVAEAQTGRAEMGLPSSATAVEELLARDDVDLAFGFPMSPEEFDAVMARGTGVDVGAIRAYAEPTDEFGGLWQDNATGGVMTVAFTADVARHEEALRMLLGDVALRVVLVEHRLEDLRRVQSELDPSAPLGRGRISGTGVYEDLNRINVGVIALDDHALRDLGALVDPATVCVEPVAGPPRDAPPGGGGPDVIAVPSSEVRNGEEALLEGTLRGDPGLDGGCVWIEFGDGVRSTVAWPPAWGARFTPDGVELLDDTGAVVAREGDRLAMGGGGRDEPLDRCQVGQQPGHFLAGSAEVLPPP